MATYTKGFQTNEDKYKNSSNIFLKKGKTKRKDEKTEDFWDNFEYYITYYRQNPHRFCIEYLGINLHWWQQFVLYMMWFTGNSIFLASRGTGKTYLTMVYCIAKACLYPGTIIRVAAANKKQSALLLAKVKEIQRNCPMVAREIADIKLGKEDAKILFHGGSEVATAVASNNARGERCQILIIDEREICDKEIINKVFVPFLTATRQPPYLKYDEYKSFKQLETNHFIELSSIGSKTSSLYAEFEQYLGFIKEGDEDYCVFSLPYQFGLSSGVITRPIIKKMIKENTTTMEDFKSEMEVIPTGDGESSMFRFEDLNRARQIHVPLIPITDDEYIACKGNLSKSRYYQRKEENEVRLISMDVALMGTRANDNSVFTVFRLTQDGDEYIKEIAYIETMNGINVEPQVLRFKQLFYDLECDFAALDAGGVGQTVYDLCTKKTIDTIRNKKYDAWKTRNENDKLEERVLDKDAKPVLFTIKVSGAGATELHSSMITRARLNFERKKVYLLVNEEDVLDELDKKFKYNSLITSDNPQDNDLAIRLMSPFLQTNEFIKECVNTQVIKVPSGGFKIDEKNGRKDRTMSALYGFYFIDMLEQELQKDTEPQDLSAYIVGGGNNQGSIMNASNQFNNQFGNRGNSGFTQRNNPFTRIGRSAR